MNLEEFKMQWQQYDEKLSKLIIIQQKTVNKIITSRIFTLLDRLKTKKIVMGLFCGTVLFYLIANYSLYINDYRYCIPFIVVSLIFTISLAYYAKMVLLIHSFNLNSHTIVACQHKISKIKINEKREGYLSLMVACPLLLICLPPLTSITFNRLNFYENLTAYLPGLVIAAIIAAAYGIYIYKRNIKIIKDIEQEVNGL